MKKYSRKLKKTMKRSMRSKKMTRRRQRGGEGNAAAPAASAPAAASAAAVSGPITINCKLNPATGAITATSSNSSVTVTPSKNTLVITTGTPIKNIQFGNATAAKVGSGAGIMLQDLADSLFVVPASSFMHSRQLTKQQKKLNTGKGMAFSSGVKVTNLNAGNLGITGTAEAPFVVTITV